MHRNLTGAGGSPRRVHARLGSALVIAVLLASPLSLGLAAGLHGAMSSAPGGSPSARPSLSAVLASPYVPIPYSEAGYGLAGAVPTGVPLPGQIPIVVTLAYSNATELGSWLAALNDPSSPAYHRYLSANEFDAAFAPASAAYDVAVSYFEAFGASSVRTYADRVTISFDGAPADVDRMFHTQIEPWRADGRAYYAPASPVALPSELASVVSTVVGLSSYSDASIHLDLTRSLLSSPPADPTIRSATPTGYLPPAEVGGEQLEYGPDLQVAYDEPSLFTERGYPTDAVIATILWQGYYNGSTPLPTPYGVLNPGDAVGPYVPSDIAAYFNQTSPPGQPHARAYGVPVGGAMGPGPLASYDTTDAGPENTLDLEMAGSLAPGATIFNVYGTTPSYSEIDTAFAFILNPNASYPALANVSVISNSWADQDGLHPEWNQYLEETAARGITVLAATGDSGDYPGSPWHSGNPPDVNTTFPASLATDTYGVVGVGVCTITLDPGSLHIDSSTVWNVPSALTGTTSGISPFYAEPTWQRSSSADPLIAGLGRGIPDVAAIASNALVTITVSGYQFNATNASLTGSDYGALSGTSVACPVEAGVVAEIDHVLATERDPPLAFMLPDLYRLATEEYGPLVNTPTTGYLNGSLYVSPLPTLPLSDTVHGSNHYYAARPGYDLVTGWGSLDAYNYTMYFLTAASTGEYGRLSGVENDFSLDGLSVTSHGSASEFNASIQQNMFVADSLGAPVYWVQNVIYINWTATGWSMDYTGWVAYPFFGLYLPLVIYEYNYPLTGHNVPLPATFDLRTVLDLGSGFNNQSVEYFVGSHEVSLPAPGAAYIIGNLWYNYSWQGTVYENGPYPGNPTPGGLSPQFGLVGGPSGGTGVFATPTAGTMYAAVEPYGSGTFEAANTRTFGPSIDQTGETAQNLRWAPAGGSGNWTLGVSPGSGTQGVLSYQPPSEYWANFTETGLPVGSLWYVNISHGASYASTSTMIPIALPAGTFAYNISADDPLWAPVHPYGTVTIVGASVVVAVPFQHLPWILTFSETGLPVGTLWNVTLGTGPAASTNLSTLTFRLSNGSYPYRIRSGTPEWIPQPATGVVTINAQPVRVNVTFLPVEYSVRFSASGLSGGATWYVNITGGTSYRSNVSVISFLEPNGTYRFTIGVGGAYTPSPASGSVNVSGGNVSLGIEFAGPSLPASGLPPWTIAVVVVIVGAIVGVTTFALTRRRAPPAR